MELWKTFCIRFLWNQPWFNISISKNNNNTTSHSSYDDCWLFLVVLVSSFQSRGPSSMIITMDILENMLAEASSTLDSLAVAVQLSPDPSGAGSTSASGVPPCRSNISTPSPPPCDDYDDPKPSMTSRSVSITSQSDVLSSVVTRLEDQIKSSASPFSIGSSSSLVQIPENRLLQSSELSRGNLLQASIQAWHGMVIEPNPAQ